MITEKEFEGAILNEYRLLRHVYSLVDQEKLNYRFSAKQRSTLEVLQYLGSIAGGMIASIHAGNLEPFKESTERQNSITYDNFRQKIDEEEARVIALLKKFSTTELDVQLDLFKRGSAMRKAQWLIFVLQILSAYRMQLFLQIKAGGRDDIGTTDLWAGFSLPKKD